MPPFRILIRRFGNRRISKTADLFWGGGAPAEKLVTRRTAKHNETAMTARCRRSPSKPNLAYMQGLGS